MTKELKVHYKEFNEERKRVETELYNMIGDCRRMVTLVELNHPNGSFKEMGLHISSQMITVEKTAELVNAIHLGMEAAKNFKYNGYGIIRF